jgi:molybdopterin converting factor subunit 1
MNRVKVLFFATLRQLMGLKSIEIEIPAGTDVETLKERLVIDYPVLTEAMKTVVIAVNREFAPDEAVIPAGGEIALFPPVSGG